MARIFFNEEVIFKGNPIWEAQNGATRITLVLISKLGELKKLDRRKSLVAKIGFLEKGKHSFIFLNPSSNQKRVVGVFLNRKCGYTVKRGNSIFESSSTGGYGNSESKFGVYDLGTLLEVHSYKHRKGNEYFQLRSNGWKYLGTDIPLNSDLESIQCID